MGNCSAQVSAEQMETIDKRRKNKEFDSQLQQQAYKEAMKFKLLLLGAGESGKSTIFKQIKAIYGDQYSEDERITFISTIHDNIIKGMKSLIEQVIIQNLYANIECKQEFDLFNRFKAKDLTIDAADAVRTLWSDPIIQSQWDRRSEFQLMESVQRYFDRIDVIMSPSYVPDFHDMLYSRMRTSGICCETYNIEGVTFELYDVGGQRNERKKWINCFEGVNTILFVAALSEYDQNLFEDSSVNRMVEALDIFEEICNNKYFVNTSMILFLNKKDLFDKKIKQRFINQVKPFSDYSGPDGDFEAGLQYFVNKFLARNKVGTYREIYYHVTCATETSNVKLVFDSCKDIIIRENLMRSGFLA